MTVAPRVKFFSWLLMHGRIKTYAFLYAKNLGPANHCVFCGLEVETAEHIFCRCGKIQTTWQRISVLTGNKVFCPMYISNGNWLEFSNSSSYRFRASIIAAVVWFIWKARCDKIFNNDKPNFTRIADMAFEHVNDYQKHLSDNLRIGFCMLNRPMPGFINIFSAACWTESSGKSGIGFHIINSDGLILIAGYNGAYTDSRIEAGLLALKMALFQSLQLTRHINQVYISCQELWSLIGLKKDNADWRSHPLFSEVHALLLQLKVDRIDQIPGNWNSLAVGLASKALMDVQPSMFFCGLEKPRWLMKLINYAGLEM